MVRLNISPKYVVQAARLRFPELREIVPMALARSANKRLLPDDEDDNDGSSISSKRACSETPAESLTHAITTPNGDWFAGQPFDDHPDPFGCNVGGNVGGSIWPQQDCPEIRVEDPYGALIRDSGLVPDPLRGLDIDMLDRNWSARLGDNMGLDVQDRHGAFDAPHLRDLGQSGQGGAPYPITDMWLGHQLPGYEQDSAESQSSSADLELKGTSDILEPLIEPDFDWNAIEMELSGTSPSTNELRPKIMDKSKKPKSDTDEEQYRSCLDKCQSEPVTSVESNDAVTWDTCFGELTLEATSTFKDDGKTKTQNRMSAQVDLTTLGGVVKLSFADTKKYAGIVAMPALVKLLKQHRVKLVGTLFAAQLGKNAGTGECHKPEMRVVVYGRIDDQDAVGTCLSDAGMYLQHPKSAEYDPIFPYVNPQYLVRPGGEMPRIDELRISDDEQGSQVSDRLNEGVKSELFRILDTINTYEGSYEACSSPRLASRLKPHQEVALAMMIERESGQIDGLKFPSIWEGLGNHRYRHRITGAIDTDPRPMRGGILADDMGLGKTLSLLSLLCCSLDAIDCLQPSPDSPRATLIITPKTSKLKYFMAYNELGLTHKAIPGWEKQIKTHIKYNRLRYFIYHGANRGKVKPSLVREYDIVITTYETIRQDWRTKDGLSTETWYRIVLDEAHRIRSRSSQVFKAVSSLKAHIRWCLTGTPIQNSIDDYGALLSFMQMPVLETKSAFDYWIASPVKRQQLGYIQTLQALVAATAFRRTKKTLDSALQLPKKVERSELVHLTAADQEVYDYFKAKASKTAAELSGEALNPGKQAGADTTLALINILRLICDYGERLLPKSALEQWRNRDRHADVITGPCGSVGGYLNEEGFVPDNRSTPTRDKAAGSSAKPGDVYDAIGRATYSPGEMAMEGCPESSLGLSPKMIALLKNLETEQRGTPRSGLMPAKSVVFSQWTKMLDLMAPILHSNNYDFVRLDGGSSLADRQLVIERFTRDESCTVMLASIGSAGEGIDLTAASSVHIMEPHWNPMLEAQAVDRVHRIGQSREVIVTRYLTVNSIEDYVRWVQEDKIAIIQQSLASVPKSQAELEYRRWKKLQALLSNLPTAEAAD
ncbi:hypothetical protein BO82DRAFT_433433 [Aspergillus uvarum CBS 121591]|uniref:Uncharacterized protein n=1 Tax=Aspergillus uvarum CBS 121591 TaxID=1448315 RepID=A0A319C8H0_9EURO|nr:hypothetical protein BO82DRAFT_433433 [Aspergillus uvarum CBS 121591]PYH80229.1 hypothetical protein BO82DRAFT_433433 [Aspergillus uvarum CBS 121591]